MMPRRAPRTLAILALLLVALGAAVLLLAKPPPALEPRPSAERPELKLLTPLPIVFAGGLALDAPPSPVLEALEGRYRVEPMSVTDAATLNDRKLLLMAQPRAQPAEMLVDLDSWVRGGGRVLLLADPALIWPSERALGDNLRPPLSFADTGLLKHWGLRLDAPDALGTQTRIIEGREIRTNSPGTLVATGGRCIVSGDGTIARCRVGDGLATVIADADFLNVDNIEGADRDSNLDLLLDELARLER